MKIHTTSIFAASAEMVFELLRRGDTIAKLTEGFPISYDSSLPEYWQEGEPINLRPRFYGFAQGDHFVTFTKIDREQLLLCTQEYGSGIRCWNHTMEIRALDDGTCHYTDMVTIHAGIKTPLVGLIANKLYQHRQQQLSTLLSQR